MQERYYRGRRAQWRNAFSAGFERDSRPRSMSAGADSDAHWVCDAHELTRRLFGSMVRRIAALPLPIGLEAAAGKLTSRRKEGTEREFLVSAAYRGIFRSKSALQRTQYQADGCILMVTGRSIWISRFMFLMCVF